MSNPVDDYLAGAAPMVKQAGPWGQLPLPGMGKLLRGSRTMEDLGSGALQAAGGLAVTGAVGAVAKVYQALRKKRDFDAMLDVNPQLAERQEEDPKRFNYQYNSMRAIAPQLAQDPVMASSIMLHMSSNPEAAGRVLLEYARGAPAAPTVETGPKGVTFKGIRAPGY